MRNLAQIAAAAALAFSTLTIAAVPADAATHQRVAAGRCGVSGNVWSATFYGERKDMWDNMEFIHQTACFKTQATCKDWLYWAYSNWPYMNNSKRCHKVR